MKTKYIFFLLAIMMIKSMAFGDSVCNIGVNGLSEDSVGAFSSTQGIETFQFGTHPYPYSVKKTEELTLNFVREVNQTSSTVKSRLSMTSPNESGERQLKFYWITREPTKNQSQVVEIGNSFTSTMTGPYCDILYQKVIAKNEKTLAALRAMLWSRAALATGARSIPEPIIRHIR